MRTRTLPIRTRGRRRGFSVTEMLVVLAVVAILSTLSVMSYRSYRRGRLASEAGRRVESVLSLAREFAIAENETHQAVIDIDNGSLWVDRGTSGTMGHRPKITTPIFLPDLVRVDRVRTSGEDRESGVAGVEFQPDGSATEATIDIVENNVEASSVTLRVYRSTGRSRLIEY